MDQLKPLTREGIAAALEKVERYRLLNEPLEAESICRDVLALDPANQHALTWLLLALTDQFGRDKGATVEEARELLPRFEREYDRMYYAGIICERRAKALLNRRFPGSSEVAFQWFHEAMQWYEKAEPLRPAGNDSALLRWNTCARLIKRYGLHPAPDDKSQQMLE